MRHEYNIPTDWSEVRWRDYKRFYDSIRNYEGTPEYADKLLDRASLHLCNIPSDELRRLPVDAFNEISNGISELLMSSDNNRLVKSFTIGDTKYGFIPKLDEMSYGEYIDLVSYTQDTWGNIPIIMSILYRNIIEEDKSGRYVIQSYTGTNEDVIELMSNTLTMDIVFGAIGFFRDGSVSLLRVIHNSFQIGMMLTQEPTGQPLQTSTGSGAHTVA